MSKSEKKEHPKDHPIAKASVNKYDTFSLKSAIDEEIVSVNYSKSYFIDIRKEITDFFNTAFRLIRSLLLRLE